MSEGRGSPPGGADRVLDIDDATVGRAGDAATRLALEEALLRRGWRVLYFDDRFGPLFGSRRSKVIDGIAVRLKPGDEEQLDLRLIRFESGTLELPPGLVERVRRVADSTAAGWIVAAFDGEQLRLVPDPDPDARSLGPVEMPGAQPEARRGGRGRGSAPSEPPTPTAARARAGAAAASEAGAAAPVSAVPRGRRSRGGAKAGGDGRRRQPSQPRAAKAPPGRPSRRGRAGARPAPPPVEAPRSAQAPEEPTAQTEAEGRRGRRRGKRGGRRRSSR